MHERSRCACVYAVGKGLGMEKNLSTHVSLLDWLGTTAEHSKPRHRSALPLSPVSELLCTIPSSLRHFITPGCASFPLFTQGWAQLMWRPVFMQYCTCLLPCSRRRFFFLIWEFRAYFISARQPWPAWRQCLRVFAALAAENACACGGICYCNP